MQGIAPGNPRDVVLTWAVAQARQPAGLIAYARALDPNTGAPVGGSGDHTVLHWLYPPVRWQPGDLIPDVHTLHIDPGAPPGAYLWVVGAYVPPLMAALPAAGGLPSPLQDTLVFGAARLPEPATDAALPDAATPLDVTFADGISLRGFELSQGGDAWTLTLYWRADSAPGGDYTMFVHALAGGALIAQNDQRPHDGALPTWAWRPGEIVTTTHPLTLPQGAAPDALVVGLYSYPSLERLAVAQSSLPVDDNQVQVWPEK